MYSGLLPKGWTEDDLSDEEQEEAVEEKRTMEEKCESSVMRDAPVTPTVTGSPTCSLPGVSQDMWQVCGRVV